MSFLIFFYSIIVNNFLFPQPNHLPINFYIWFLPFDGFSWQWAVNYLLQLSSAIASEYYVVYCPMTLILMNHSCWKVDMVLLKVKDLENFLQTQALNPEKQLNKKPIEDRIKKIINASEEVMSWQDKLRKLLQISFLGEFTLMSVFFCSCLHSLVGNFQEAFATFGMMSGCSTQIYFYCWMGTRIENRFLQLSTCIYDLEWNQLDSKQQKDIQMILLAAQNLRGFHGIFKKVNLSSFQKVPNIRWRQKDNNFKFSLQVLEWTYSLSTFVRTIE